jgi:hypothetical protein
MFSPIFRTWSSLEFYLDLMQVELFDCNFCVPFLLTDRHFPIELCDPIVEHTQTETQTEQKSNLASFPRNKLKMG